MGDISTPIRSEELWFEDGDIILSVAEDGVEHHFRVHNAILVIHSPVFRDMVSLGPPSGDETLPVPLIDDSVQDVTALLSTLYCGRVEQIMTFDAALGILRLSHKYQIIGLQKMIKRKLLEDWSLNYFEYLARLAYFGFPGNRIPEALKLVETAQRIQANELLPTAFYELAVVWGTKWPELIQDLSPENVARLWVGRARSEQRLRSFVTGTESAPPLMWASAASVDVNPTSVFQHRGNFDQCSAFDGCHGSAFSNFQTKLKEYAFNGLFAHTALQRFQREHLGKKVCEQCKTWFMSVLENKSQELWESIPADFDLPAIGLELYSQSNITNRRV